MILSPFILLLYAVGIQYKRGSLWLPVRAVCFVIAAIALMLDSIAHYTEWWLVFGAPRPGEHTISRRLDRMEADPDEAPARREFARLLNVVLDACEPDGKH